MVVTVSKVCSSGQHLLSALTVEEYNAIFPYYDTLSCDDGEFWVVGQWEKGRMVERTRVLRGKSFQRIST